MSVAGGPDLIQNGLVLCLDAANPKSYPRSGSIWRDLNNNKNGILTNGAIFNSDKGGSIVFDGLDDYVNMSNFTNPYAETIIVFARSATTNWSQTGWISSSRRQNGHIIHPTQSTKNLDYYLFDQNGAFTYIWTYNVPDITIPHMYSISTNGSNFHKVYLDGLLTGTSTSSITRTQNPTAQPWYLGWDDGLARYGNGNIYYVIRYNRQLSDLEMLQNYNALKGRFLLT
jgi:hypothetical protein